MRVGRTQALRLLFCLLLSALLGVPAALAQTLVLTNLVLDNQAGSVMVRFGIDAKGQNVIAMAVEEGVPTQLEVEASLYRVRDYVLDKRLARAELRSSLRFDPLTREYVVETPPGDNPLRSKRLEELLARSWGSLDIDLGPWSVLERGNAYRLRLDTALRQTDVPQWIKTLLFFWDWDLTPSAGYELEFTY